MANHKLWSPLKVTKLILLELEWRREKFASLRPHSNNVSTILNKIFQSNKNMTYWQKWSSVLGI